MTDILEKIAQEAGKAILKVYQQENLEVSYKDDHSPLSLADRVANEIIVSQLQKYFPQIPILSEEEAQTPYEIRQHWTKFFLVDPLDGTKEFIKRNGEFTVNIALIENHFPILGVIYVPVGEQTYVGQAGLGAYKGIENQVFPLKITPKNPNEGVVVVGSRSHSSPQEEQFLKNYRVLEKISKGSSLKFCLVAEQKAQLYFRANPTMEWDTAAGQAIVEAAGGKVLDQNGERFAYNKENLRNGAFLCTIFEQNHKF